MIHTILTPSLEAGKLVSHLSNQLGFVISLLLHGGGLAWFLSASTTTQKIPGQPIIEVSFVQRLPEISSSSSSRKPSERIEGDYPGSISTPNHRSRISAAKPTKKTRLTNATKIAPTNPHSDVSPPPRSAQLLKVVPPQYHAGSHKNPLPSYPYVSRRRGEEGKVTCAVKVNPEGQPETVEIKESSGYKRLDNAAQTVLSSWIFKPAEQNSQKIYGFVVISISFHLTEGIKI